MQNWARDNCTMIICGHTHNSRFPDLYDPPYFNDGCCVYPAAITAIEIECGCISLVKWSIMTKEDNSMYVGKEVLNGPVKLEDYFETICFA